MCACATYRTLHAIAPHPFKSITSQEYNIIELINYCEEALFGTTMIAHFLIIICLPLAALSDPLLSAILTNGAGLIKMGVYPEGMLNADGGVLTGIAGPFKWYNDSQTVLDYSDEDRTKVGIRYIFPDGSEGEATAYGEDFEGWGVSVTLPDNTTDRAWANNFAGKHGNLQNFTSNDGIIAMSKVTTENGALRITHDFHPSNQTDNLYEVTVQLENISDKNLTHVKYRRTMDWDVHPYPFWECTTIQPDPSLIGFLVAAHTNGFQQPDPEEPTNLFCGSKCPDYVYAPVLNHGPSDHGATFDFDFRGLDVGETFEFRIYYGAAKTLGEADLALRAVNAETWSYGTPADGPRPTGVCADMNNEYEHRAVYIFAFAGVGGPGLANDGQAKNKSSKSKKNKGSNKKNKGSNKKTKTTEKTGSSYDLFE